jgi:hypothetical protein
MEVVLLQEFGSTETQHIWMDISSCQLRTQVIRTMLRLGDRGGSTCLTYDLAVFSNFEAREQELLVDLGSVLIKLYLG